jgi:YesN/AraC family two-component response regulator
MAKYDIALLRQTKILFAGDNDELRKTQLEVFNRLFKKVYTAKDGREAIKVFLENKNEIDVIVSDINMLEFDGLHVASKIREVSTVPIILVSVYTDPHYTLKAIDLKIEKYLVKPVTINDIINAIEVSVKFHQKQEQEKLVVNYLKTNSKKNAKDLEELISENKKLENQNYKNELILDNYVISFTTDNKGIILRTSKYFCELMRFSEDELIGISVNSLRSKDAQTNITKKMLEVIKAKNSITYSCPFVTKNNLTFDFHILMIPLYNDDEMVSEYKFYLKSNYLV